MTCSPVDYARTALIHATGHSPAVEQGDDSEDGGRDRELGYDEAGDQHGGSPDGLVTLTMP